MAKRIRTTVTIRADNPSPLRRGKKKNSNAVVIVIAVVVILGLLWSRQLRTGRAGIPQRIAAPR